MSFYINISIKWSIFFHLVLRWGRYYFAILSNNYFGASNVIVFVKMTILWKLLLIFSAKVEPELISFGRLENSTELCIKPKERSRQNQNRFTQNKLNWMHFVADWSVSLIMTHIVKLLFLSRFWPLLKWTSFLDAGRAVKIDFNLKPNHYN